MEQQNQAEVKACFKAFEQLDITPFDYVRGETANFSEICVFGAGWIGKCAASFLQEAGVRVDFVCDNDSRKWGRPVFNGIKCISPVELMTKKNCYIVVAMNRYLEILNQLKTMQHVVVFAKANYYRYKGQYLECLLQHQSEILEAANCFADDFSYQIFLMMLQQYATPSLFDRCWEKVFFHDEQYFPRDILPLTDEESFVDCGAYTGDSFLAFLRAVQRNFSKAYLFELGKENFQELNKTVQSLDMDVKKRISTYNLGVWDRYAQLPYDESRKDANNLTGLGNNIFNNYAEVDALDHVLKETPVSYIKMDIEGAELQALRGAADIIHKQKPKLAISMYHKLEDLWTLPLYIKELNPGYKLYLRTHTWLDQDIVCYAVQ